jgi:hypothetical protein
MNGMSYLMPSFTLPACNKNTSQLKWDLAFMTKADFMAKYKWDETTYDIEVS